MLTNSPVSAILPTTDLGRARDFYQNKLGLTATAVPFDDPLMFEAGNKTVLVVYHRPEGTKAEHTVAGFMVTNIEDQIAELKTKGVVFEDYDMPGFNHINHVMDYGNVKSAWFKDPDGNILAINQL